MTEQTTEALIAEFRSEGNEWSGKYGRMFFEAADALEAAERDRALATEGVQRLIDALDTAYQRAEDAERARDGWAANAMEYASAIQDRDRLAAVVEKVREYASDLHSGSCQDVLDILTAAPADDLRERDADKWDEGYGAGHMFGLVGKQTANPYREEQS